MIEASQRRGEIMRRPYLYFSIIFFLFSILILFLTPSMQAVLESKLTNSDFLFPFSLYNGIFNAGIRPAWVFGGYTPFTELFLGLLLWIPFKNTLLTYILFAFVQICFVTASVVYLASRIVGRNLKIFSLIIAVSAVSILIYAAGYLNNLYNLFFWYLHITTFYLGLFTFSLLIDFSTAPGTHKKRLWISLSLMLIISTIAIISDQLFISQFIAPGVILLFFLLLLKAIPFRRGMIGLICLFSSIAFGEALFRLPEFLGNERMILTGYFIQFSKDTILNGFQSIINLISNVWEGSTLVAAIWISFYVLCLILAAIAISRWLKNGQGIIRKKLGICILFFVFQGIMTLSAALISVDIALRYFLPVLFIPLIWGWPILALVKPGWMKSLHRKFSYLTGAVIIGFAVLILIPNVRNAGKLAELWNYYPQNIQCLDENASRQNLHFGIAQFWEARPISLLSKSGLTIVQVLPDLQAYPFLNDINLYHNDFEFIVVDIGTQIDTSIDRGLVIQRFGEPASTFTCSNYEILVYNRASDASFAKQFSNYSYIRK